LKILDDGLIHASQATLVRGTRRDWTDEQRAKLKALAMVLDV
jgi:ATP phosphoribosyltransferase